MRASSVAASLSLISALTLAPAAQAAFPGANGRLAFALTGQPGGAQGSGLVTMLPDGGGGAAAGSGASPTGSPTVAASRSWSGAASGRRCSTCRRPTAHTAAGSGSRPSGRTRRGRPRRAGRPTAATSCSSPTRGDRTAVRAVPRPHRRTRPGHSSGASPATRTSASRRRRTGCRIAFSELVRNPSAIALFAMPASGGHALRLATLGAAAEPPGRIDWSPDSTRVALDGDGIQISAGRRRRARAPRRGRTPAGVLARRAAGGLRALLRPAQRGLVPDRDDVVTLGGSDRHTVATDARGITSQTWQALPAG